MFEAAKAKRVHGYCFYPNAWNSVYRGTFDMDWDGEGMLTPPGLSARTYKKKKAHERRRLNEPLRRIPDAYPNITHTRNTPIRLCPPVDGVAAARPGKQSDSVLSTPEIGTSTANEPTIWRSS
ncbi:hypothetical protein VTH06DRAFT_2987 [Thermothelomyces fergusii]